MAMARFFFDSPDTKCAYRGDWKGRNPRQASIIMKSKEVWRRITGNEAE